MKHLAFFKTIGLSLIFIVFEHLAAAAGSFDGVSTPVNSGDNITVSGWAAGYDVGAPVDYVRVYIDDNYAGAATLGGYRPDVQEVNVANRHIFSWRDVSYSGWSMGINSGGLGAGEHRMVVYAVYMALQWVDDGYGDGSGYWDWVESWEYIGSKAFTITSQPPHTESAGGTDVELGQTTTLSGRATSPTGSLQWMDFYVSGPTMPNWNYIGGVSISGGDATGQISWKPPMVGSWAVHVRARDTAGQRDTNANIVGGFTVREPVIAPPSSPQYIVPNGEITFAFIGDTLEVPTYTTGYYDEWGNWIEETNPGSVYYWNGSNWEWRGQDWTYTVTASGLYELEGGVRVYVLNVRRNPTATLLANCSSAFAGDSVTLTFTVGDADGDYDYANLWVATPNIGWRWIHSDNSLASGGALDRNHSATAYGVAGSHSRTFAVKLSDGFGIYTFALAAVDGQGARTDAPNVTVSVANRAPSGTFMIDNLGASKTIVVGQSVTLASTMTDLDGNLQYHSFWWDLGNNTCWANPWRDWSVPQNATGWSSLTGVGWLVSSGYNNSLSGVWTGYAPGTYSFHCAGGDGIDWVGNTLSGPSILYVSVIKASPSITFPAIASANVGQTVALNASVSGAYNTSSGISYSIISTSGGVAGVINGTTLNVASLGDGNPGAITVRATYPGDGNNNSASADQTFTVPNRAPSIVLSANAVTSPGGVANSMTVTTGTVLNFSASASDADGNYQRTRVWARQGSGGWNEIRNTANASDSFQYTLNGIDSWAFHSRSLDNSGVESATAIINVTSTGQPASATVTPEKTTFRIDEAVRLAVTGSCASGLSEIGLERCDASGNLIANSGSISTGATSASQTFSWTPSGAGTYYFAGYAWNSDRSHRNRTSMVGISVILGPPPSAAVTVDGYSSGQTIIWWDGMPAPTVTVRYKATDADGNLTGIRPQAWTQWDEWVDDPEYGGYYETREFFDNNNGQFEARSGSSGEVVRSYTLDHDTDWYFWTDGIDGAGQFVSSGAWGSGFKLTVIRKTAQPSLTVQYLDSSGTVLAPEGDGRIHVPTGTQMRVRLIASSPENTLARLCWRLKKPENAAGIAPGAQWSWGGWGWGGETAVSGNTTWTSELLTLNEGGTWDFWHHAQAIGAGVCPADGNSFGWATVNAPDIEVESGPAPVAIISVDGYPISGGTIPWYVGMPAPTVTVRYKATDADGNLTGIRPQAWTQWDEWVDDPEYGGYYETREFFDNNNGQFEARSGSSGEVVRSYTLDHDTDWYFWTDGIDGAGQFVSSGAWGSGFKLSVVRQQAQPSLTVQYLDAQGNVLAPREDGLVYVQSGAPIRLRFIATSPGNSLAKIYWRLKKPGNWQGTAPGSQWSWGGWGWGGDQSVSGNTTWTSEPFVMYEGGVWDLWCHASATGAGQISGDGNGWATVNGPDFKIDAGAVPVPSVKVDGRSSGDVIYRSRGGEVYVKVRYTATDADANLTGIQPFVQHPDAEHDGYWEWQQTGVDSETNQPIYGDVWVNPDDSHYNDNSGNMVGQSGSSGEVVRDVLLNKDGEWYFWAHAEDRVLNASTSGDGTAGFKLTLLTDPNDANKAPVPSVEVDGHGVNDNVGLNTTVSVHFKATDQDGNLRNLRYNIWHEGDDQNKTGPRETKTGLSGEIVRSEILNKPGNWYFWTEAWDALSTTPVTSGPRTQGFRIHVVNTPNTPPVPYVECDDYVSGATIVAQGAVTVQLRYKATDADGNLTGLRPNVVHPNSESGGVYADGYHDNNGGRIEPVSGAQAELVRSVTLEYDGNYTFWGEAQDLITAPGLVSGEGNPFVLYVESGISADPRPQVQLGALPVAIKIGDPLQLSSGATVASGHFAGHSFWARGPRISDAFSDSFGWLRDQDATAGWSDLSNPGVPSGEMVSSKTGKFTPSAPGYWQFAANAWNAQGALGVRQVSRAVFVAPSANVTMTCSATNRQNQALSATDGGTMTLQVGDRVQFASHALANGWLSQQNILGRLASAPGSEPSITVLQQPLEGSASQSENAAVASWMPTEPGDYTFFSEAFTGPEAGATINRGSSLPITISVLPENNAVIVDQSYPAQLTVNQSGEVRITVRNTGHITWTAGTYYLGDLTGSSRWGLARVDVDAPVARGQEKTFVFNITAPSSPGVYPFQWRMVQQGVESFGDPTPIRYLTVVANSALDSDGDGMPDAWETAHGLDPNSAADVLEDPDHDGLTNAAEYNLGKDPKSYDHGTSTLGNTLPAGWAALVAGDASRTEAVGMTPGQFSVDKSGAATYSIAIATTPGTAGMEPKLSLGYSSQAGSGIAGQGWSIGGLSTITRGPKTRAIDGEIHGIDFSPDDRFYLDGQRLIECTGTYGADGTEYRTELESFSRIVSYGTSSQGQGPAYFKVWTKAGLVMEFGNTTDSARNGRGATMAWHVNKVSDTAGNYMTFTYGENTLDGTHTLTRIDYTGNSRTGAQAYASVRFVYEGRQDSTHGYVSGVPIAIMKRLKAVEAYYGEQKVRSYALSYVVRQYTGRSLLGSITETGSDGKSYPPLMFEYSNPSAGWDSLSVEKWAPPAQLAGRDNVRPRTPRGIGFMDLNGDGRPDLVQSYSGYVSDSSRGVYNGSTYVRYNRVWLNDPVQGWVDAPSFRLPEDVHLARDWSYNHGNNIAYPEPLNTQFMDFNADGLVDIVNNDEKIYLNTGAGFSSPVARWNMPLPPGSPDMQHSADLAKPYYVDVNGDGFPDYIGRNIVFDDRRTVDDGEGQTHEEGSYWGTLRHAWLNRGPGSDNSEGAGWQYAANYAFPFTVSHDLRGTEGTRFLDVNGDGLVDIVRWYHDTRGYNCKGVALNTGQGWNVLAENSAEFNRYLPPEPLAIGINHGGGFDTAATIGTELVDLNGDGLIDQARRYDSAPHQLNKAYFNTGNGWVEAPANYNFPVALAANHSPHGSAFLDLNNDGTPDFVHAWGSENSVHIGSGALGWSTTSGEYNLQRPFAADGVPSYGSDFVDINADGAVDNVWHWNNNGAVEKQALANKRVNPDRLVKATTGFGVSVGITYAPLTERDPVSGDFTVYKKAATAATYPQADIIGPMYVVKTVSNDDGTGGTYDLEYFYEGMRADVLRGNLGFQSMTVVDARTDISSTTSFRQDYPYIGMPVESKTVKLHPTAPPTTLSSSSTTYDKKVFNDGKTHFVFAKTSEQKTYELDGTLTSSSTTTTIKPDGQAGFDNYGNALYLSVSSSDGYSKTTVSTYDNIVTANNWYLGRLLTATVTAAATGVPTQTRKSSFEYDTVTGLLNKEIVEPDRASDPENFTLTTTYQHDTYGNKISATITGGGLGDLGRTTSTSYNPADVGQTGPVGRFPYKTTNARGHTEKYTYDNALGVPLSLTGPNDLATSWLYDGFARKIKETRADTTVSETRYRWALPSSTSPVAGACYLTETESTGSPPAVAFYDRFGRGIATYGLNGGGLDGNARIVGSRTEYDSKGRAYRTTLPFYYTDTPTNWVTTTHYDDLNRPLRVSTPDDEVSGGLVYSSVVYKGLVTESTNPKGQVEYLRKNTQGQVVERINNYGATDSKELGHVTYVYDAYGQLLTTTVYKEDRSKVTTSIVYDVRGRKKTMVDPDMGTWDYAYNAAGELTSQTDAKNQTTTMVYDALGRLKTRTEAEGTTTWTYDTAERGTSFWYGKLAEVAVAVTDTVHDKAYSEKYSYDAYGRPSTVVRNIDGADYSINQSYDSVGRPLTTTYPSKFKVKNVYNAFGFLKEVREAGLGSGPMHFTGQVVSGQVFWQADSYALNGQVDGATFGNGLTYDRVFSAVTGRVRAITSGIGAGTAIQYQGYLHDALGQVTDRIDEATGRREHYVYDGLNRLRSTTVTVVGSTPSTATATVSYDALGNILTKSDVGDYEYTGVGPHAVSRVSGGPLGTVAYSYDANGNMYGSGGDTSSTRSIDWTSFNQVRKITQGAVNTEFWFGASRERVIQKHSNGTTTHYVGALFEKVTGPGNFAEEKNYIYTPLGRTAVLTVRSDFKMETRYFHQDALGSIYAVTDEYGRVEKRFTYDPWGKRINTQDEHTGSGGKVTRGYTDHEHLEDFGLIHMNGRVFDPVLGRFLSADPFIQDAADSQAYNRYSYCSNEPVNHTDPSGYFKLSLKMVVIIVVAIVISVVTYGAASGAMYAAGTAATATTAGTAATGVLAGSVAAGTISATTAGVIAGAVGGAVAGFASGFACSLLNGGSIGDSFRSGLTGAAAGIITGGVQGYFGDVYSLSRVVSTAVAGGISSEIEGGEFSHGFKFAGALALVTYGAVKAREYEWNTSPPEAKTGTSPGFRGRPGKLAGSRPEITGYDPQTGQPLIQPTRGINWLGGEQGSQGYSFEWKYEPGSIRDHLFEAFSGVHDFLNHPWTYNSQGYVQSSASLFGRSIAALTTNGVARGVSETMSWVNVALAAPVVTASMVPESGYSVIASSFEKKKRK